MSRRFATTAATLALVLCAAPAAAHVTLETASAAAGAYYKAVLKLPHGCKGAATVALKVTIPEGVIGVKPQPKPGWALETTRAPYAKSYNSHGRTVTEGVVAIRWHGGNLPDDWYDEFVFQGQLAGGKTGETLYFPVEQICTDGAVRWDQRPATPDGPPPLFPAPTLKLTAPPGGGHAHH